MYPTKVWIIGLLLLGPSLVFAQYSLSDYGKVSPEELALENIEAFPDVSAVILFDAGLISFDPFNSAPRVLYQYHRRIKILDPQAFQVNPVRIHLRGGRFRDDLVSLEAATYNFNVEGEPIQFALKKRKYRDIKQPDGSHIIEFELPLIKAGSVVEFSYQLSSRDLRKLRDWPFQDSLPILYSECNAFIPRAYDYLIGFNGNALKLNQEQNLYSPGATENPASRTMGRNITQVNRQSNLFYSYLSGMQYRFSMEEIPAFVKEEFSPQTSDYLPGLTFNLNRDIAANRDNPDVFDDWIDLNRRVQKYLRLRKPRLDRKMVSRVLNQFSRRDGDLAECQAIYQFVRTEFNWNEEYGLDVGNLNQAFQKRTGNGTQINLILYHLLEQSGYDVRPVLISTRSHGKVQTALPVLDQFNHLLVRLKVDGEYFLMDALSDKPDFGILPRNDLNQLGYMLGGEKGDWIRMGTKNALSRTTYTRFSMDDSGQLTGSISVIHKEHRAALERDRMVNQQESSTQFMEKYVLTEVDEYQLGDTQVENMDNPDAPLIIDAEIVTTGFTEQAGEFMFLKPVMTYPVNENPFELEQRMTPIDLAYPLRENYMLGLILPPNYQVEQLPEPIRVVMPNNAGSFTFNAFVDENILHLTSVLHLNQTLFLPEEYNSIRTFFDYVTQKHEEGVVLKRIP